MTYVPEHLKPYKRPDHYIGAEFPGYFEVYGVHRDSDTLARSNFRSILRRLGFKITSETGEVRSDAPNYDPDLPAFEPGADPDDVNAPIVVTRASHFLVGWVDTIRIHRDAVGPLRTADQIVGKLDDYLIVDEDDFSELEYEEACEYWASLSVRERVAYLQEARDRASSHMSIFAARRAELPEDPAGRLYERLTRC